MLRTRALPLFLMLSAPAVALAQPSIGELMDDGPAAAPPSAAAPGSAPPSAPAAAPAEAPAEAPPPPAAPAEAPPPPAPPAEATPPPAAKAEKTVVSETARADTGRVPVQQRSAAVAGPTGLDQVWAADPGPQGTLRMRLTLNWFDIDGFPAEGSASQFTGTTLALAWTPIEYLEVFGNLRSTSNTNDGDLPTLIQTQGDFTVGAKGGYFISDSLAVGAAAMVHLVGEPGRGGPLGDATSAEFRGLFTTDLMRKRGVPFRFHFDVSYYIENGEAVYADRPDEPSLIQEWGLQVGRYDRLMLGFGFESPFHRYANLYAEYRIGTPFLVELERRGRDSNEFAFGSVPHQVTAGFRSFVLEHLALDLTARIGLADQPYTGVPATPPWMLGFAVAYTLDPRPQVIEREVAAAAPPPPPAPKAPPTGAVTGRVLAADTGAAPKDARVVYLGRDDLSPQLADAQGRFTGYRFEPGPVSIRAEAKGYLPAQAEVVVSAGQDAAVDIALKPDPKQAKGVLVVKAVTEGGRPLSANVDVGAPANLTGKTFSDRPYRAELDPGTYPVTVEADGYAAEQQTVILTGGKPTDVKLTLKKGKGKRRKKAKRKARDVFADPGPARQKRSGGKGLVYRKGKRLLLRKPITFEGDSHRLDAEGKRVVKALARYLKKRPKITKIRVDGHLDNAGEAAALKRLSERRARSVKSRLVRRGVSPKRIKVKGFGGGKPIKPNLTRRGREANRRIELRILEAK